MSSPSIPTALMSRQPTPGWDKANQKAAGTVAEQTGPRHAMSGLPAGDPIARLPARAAQKLRALRQESEELAMLSFAEVDRHQELIQDRIKAKARIDVLTNPDAAARSGHDNIYSRDHPSVIQAQAEYDRLNAQLEALQERQKARQLRSASISGLLRQVEAYAKSAGSDLSAFEMERPEPPPGETPANVVERLRQKRRELIIDLKSVDAAPIHSTVVKDKMRRQIEELAERGMPDVFRLIEGGSSVRFAQTDLTFQVHGFVPSVEGVPGIVARASGPIPDALAFQVWLHKDEVIAKLEREIDESAEDADALSDQERADRSAQIASELLSTERLEEAYTELAAGAVIRRSNLDVRAFLDVVGSEPKGV